MYWKLSNNEFDMLFLRSFDDFGWHKMKKMLDRFFMKIDPEVSGNEREKCSKCGKEIIQQIVLKKRKR
jgi:hypothetical protein